MNFTAENKRISRYAIIYLFPSICFFLLLKLSYALSLAWGGFLTSVVGTFFCGYGLWVLNQNMNTLSEIPQSQRPEISFKKPLLLASLGLIINFVGVVYFAKYITFPSKNNTVSIFVINQSTETLKDIRVKYGGREKIINQLAPKEKNEAIFTRTADPQVSIFLKADGLEREAHFGLNENISMSAVRIDNLKNILPDL